MKRVRGIQEREARQLILDELFDLTLYKKLEPYSTGDLRVVLGELVPVEAGHLSFWQDFFGMHIDELDFGGRMKLAALLAVSRLFGPSAMHLILEAIEVYGVRKYLKLWETYQDTELGDAVRGILEDELGHEDRMISNAVARRIDPEKIRSIFLGFNDGLVEMLGAVSGFFAAFENVTYVIIAWSTVTIAGSISMAAGAYAGASSEREVAATEDGKRRFFGKAALSKGDMSPYTPALYVGVSYFLGSLVPILPVFMHWDGIIASILVSVIIIVLVSLVLAFLSGMALGRRIAINLVTVCIAVTATYVIGMLVRHVF